MASSKEFYELNKPVFLEYEKLKKDERFLEQNKITGKFFKIYEDFGCYWKYYFVIRLKGSKGNTILPTFAFCMEAVPTGTFTLSEIRIDNFQDMKEIDRAEFIAILEKIKQSIDSFINGTPIEI